MPRTAIILATLSIAIGSANAAPLADITAPSRSQYATLARSIAKTKDTELAASLKQLATMKVSATELASTAAALAATGRVETALVYLGRAAQLAPADAAVANNLATTLHLAGDSKRAVSVLRYTLKLQPDNVLVLVNLAAVLADAGEDRAAESLLVRARELDPTSCEAAASLGLLYEKLRDDAEAFPLLITALQCHPTKQMRDAYNRARMRRLAANDPMPELPPPLVPFPLAAPPPAPAPASAAPPAPSGGPPDRALELPAFPDWPDAITFMASVPASKAWQQELGKKQREILTANTATAVELINRRETRTPRPAADAATKQFEYAYSDEPTKQLLDTLYREVQQQLRAIDASYASDLTTLDEPFLRKDAPAPWPTSDRCPAHRVALARQYQDWRARARRRHDDTVRVLAGYYEEARERLARFHDPLERATAETMPKLTVVLALWGHTMDYVLTRPMFYGTQMAHMPCQDQAATSPQSSAQPDETKLKDADAGLCPPAVQNGALSIDIRVFRFKLGCDKITIGFDSGVYTGSASYRSSMGELTLFAGVGFNAFDAIARPAGVSLRAKGGLYATFDLRNGAIVAAGVRVSAQAKLNVTPGEVSGGAAYELAGKLELLPVVVMGLAPYGATRPLVRPALP